MRPLQTACFFVLASALLYFGTAGADISLDLDIKNKSCDSSGDDVHARAGDKVCARLKIKNDSKEPVTMELRIVGGIPSCMLDSTVTVEFDRKETKRTELCRIVPEGLDGEMFILVVSARSSDGCVADDCAKLTFGVRDDDDDDDDWNDEGEDDDDRGDDGDDDDGDADGDSDADTGADGSHGRLDHGLLRRVVARLMARSVIAGLVPDRATAVREANFSDVKQLYR